MKKMTFLFLLVVGIVVSILVGICYFLHTLLTPEQSMSVLYGLISLSLILHTISLFRKK